MRFHRVPRERDSITNWAMWHSLVQAGVLPPPVLCAIMQSSSGGELDSRPIEAAQANPAKQCPASRGGRRLQDSLPAGSCTERGGSYLAFLAREGGRHTGSLSPERPKLKE